MRFSDIFRMSAASLVKRKLRTILTVLGVVIGIASIVVMISLGLGLSEQSMDLIEQYGGLTTIMVSEGYGGVGGEYEGKGDGSKGSLDLKLTDEIVELVKNMEHVELVSPVLSFQCILKSGAYIYEVYSGYGYSLDVLRAMGWKFSKGDFPKDGDELKFIYGNMVLQDFRNASTGAGFYDTGVIPDIDLMKAPMITIFDTSAYYSFNSGDTGSEGTDSGDNGTQNTAPPKKYLIPAAGILYGEGDSDYREYSYSVYCDIEALKNTLKKVFRGKAIPGQPTRQNGKPYRQFFYSQLYVKVDSLDNVEEVQKGITDLGYSAYSNFEWIEETRKQAESQQAMLGGIGAVSLLVAAIGIANTMMMSIYERTKEIGVMKVLGCDLRDIRSLFLIEATLIGALGGIAGDILSLAASAIINAMASEKTSVIPPWLLLLGFIFAVLVGVIAGYFPSKRAMELSPLAAIRNE